MRYDIAIYDAWRKWSDRHPPETDFASLRAAFWLEREADALASMAACNGGEL